MNTKLIDRGIKILKEIKNMTQQFQLQFVICESAKEPELDKTGFETTHSFILLVTTDCKLRQGLKEMFILLIWPFLLSAKVLGNFKRVCQKWMGQKIAPIFSEGGFDIDYSGKCLEQNVVKKMILKKVPYKKNNSFTDLSN